MEMLSRLLPLYFRPNRNKHAAALIRRLWQVNARLVVQSGVKAFNVDSTLPSVVYVSWWWLWWLWKLLLTLLLRVVLRVAVKSFVLCRCSLLPSDKTWHGAFSSLPSLFMYTPYIFISLPTLSALLRRFRPYHCLGTPTKLKSPRQPTTTQVLRIMRLVPDCAAELLGADDCAFAVAVASVAYGAEVPPPAANAQQQQQPPPPNPLPPLDLEKWGAERLGRKDRETFAGRVLSFIQVRRRLALRCLARRNRGAGSGARAGGVFSCVCLEGGVCRCCFSCLRFDAVALLLQRQSKQSVPWVPRPLVTPLVSLVCTLRPCWSHHKPSPPTYSHPHPSRYLSLSPPSPAPPPRLGRPLPAASLLPLLFLRSCTSPRRACGWRPRSPGRPPEKGCCRRAPCLSRRPRSS